MLFSISPHELCCYCAKLLCFSALWLIIVPSPFLLLEESLVHALPFFSFRYCALDCCSPLTKCEDTSDVEFVSKDLAEGDTSSSVSGVGTLQGKDVSVSLRMSKRLARSSVKPVSPPPSEPQIMELNNEDVHHLSLIAFVTGIGVKPSDVKKEFVGKPKKAYSVKGKDKEEAHELHLSVEDGDSTYVPEWPVYKKHIEEAFRLRESIYHFATPADRESYLRMANDEKFFSRHDKLKAALDGARKELEIISVREKDLVGQLEVVKAQIIGRSLRIWKQLLKLRGRRSGRIARPWS
ncbi:hypothetical protein L1987_18231 [Smallanthus sonchifolius]|uniref:Uncharacterized protein n=1 Tax=Smallanthus sonchifolius TaxID=185202 RepID=A0ACB9J184_9ASTR|nr:hypothetical protein L1987_18231 [Smallanthus sonchifolius]